jgi:hypothetical protein
MSEPDAESPEVETLEQALARNMAGSSESAEASPPDEPANGPSDVVEEAEVQESPVDALEPLEKWNDDIKTMFKGLPKDAQQFVLDRNHDVESYLTKETQGLAETRKRYERLDEVFKPYESVAKQSGVDLTPHVAQALQYYFAFQRDPAATLKALAKNASVDLNRLEDTDDRVDPSIRALRTELQQTRQEVAQLRGRDTQSAESQLEQFRTAKNDDGSAKYPHFDKLRALMAPLVGDGKTLQEAYEQASWTLPDYRKSQLDATEKLAMKKAEEARAQKARGAKAKTTLPPSDVDTGTSMPKVNGSWEKALKHTLTKME